MPELKDMTGLRFDRLTVTRHVGRDRHGYATWLCSCSCGTQKVVDGRRLRNGNVRSCGCLRRETSAACARQHLNLGSGPQCVNYRHGHASQHKTSRRSPEYRCWDAMKDRCSRPAAGEYHRYGGRGITVCERWNTFENFLADMGRKPSPKHTLDRINKQAVAEAHPRPHQQRRELRAGELPMGDGERTGQQPPPTQSRPRTWESRWSD
jgi:hypothetical protein